MTLRPAGEQQRQRELPDLRVHRVHAGDAVRLVDGDSGRALVGALDPDDRNAAAREPGVEAVEEHPGRRIGRDSGVRDDDGVRLGRGIPPVVLDEDGDQHVPERRLPSGDELLAEAPADLLHRQSLELRLQRVHDLLGVDGQLEGLTLDH